MASETPDLRLPSHPQSVTAPWPVASTKLYCLVTEAHVCEQLAQTCCLAMHQPGVERVTSRSQVRQPNHYTTEPLTLSFNQLDSCFAVWCHSCNITELVIPNEILCGVKLHVTIISLQNESICLFCQIFVSIALCEWPEVTSELVAIRAWCHRETVWVTGLLAQCALCSAVCWIPLLC